MILIRFPNVETKRAAMGALAGRFNFKSWASGEMLVPEDALPFLAVKGVVFTAEGPATYEVAYKQMAREEAHEAEALEWSDATMIDVADESR
jgi:hypothetical protein